MVIGLREVAGMVTGSCVGDTDGGVIAVGSVARGLMTAGFSAEVAFIEGGESVTPGSATGDVLTGVGGVIGSDTGVVPRGVVAPIGSTAGGVTLAIGEEAMGSIVGGVIGTGVGAF